MGDRSLCSTALVITPLRDGEYSVRREKQDMGTREVFEIYGCSESPQGTRDELSPVAPPYGRYSSSVATSRSLQSIVSSV